MNSPLVTINILSFNRKNELLNTLQKVYEQNYKNIEVIVVDNASTDGTEEMIRKEFPHLFFVGLKENIGISGWNEGFKLSNGEFILVLDDDSYPMENTIKEGVENLLRNNAAGAVAFCISNKNRNEIETKNFPENPNYFIGCGALIRKEVVTKIGGYSRDIFIYNNELDFGIRLYNAGYNIIYLGNSVVVHDQNPAVRKNPVTSEFYYYNNFLSYFIFLILNINSYNLIISLIRLIINRLIICLKFPYLNSWLKALYISAKSLKKLKKHKNNISRKTQRLFNYGYVPFVDRIYFQNYKSR